MKNLFSPAISGLRERRFEKSKKALVGGLEASFCAKPFLSAKSFKNLARFVEQRLKLATITAA